MRGPQREQRYRDGGHQPYATVHRTVRCPEILVRVEVRNAQARGSPAKYHEEEADENEADSDDDAHASITGSAASSGEEQKPFARGNVPATPLHGPLS
jgi:hypothetical protein